MDQEESDARGTDPSIVIVVVTLVIFVLCILVLTKACKCALDRTRSVTVSRRLSNASRSSIYIIEDNGDVLVINPSAGDIEKCDVKHSYENLAPPPYFGALDTLAEASYELPPSYPVDT